MRVRCGIWLEKIIVHGYCWSPRHCLTSFLQHVVMSTTSAHHAVCAPIAERHVCCFVFFPFSCSRFVSWACSHSPVLLLLLLQLLPLRLSSHPHLLPNRSILALHHFLWSHKFVCDTRATHCPCHLKTGQSHQDTPTCPWCQVFDNFSMCCNEFLCRARTIQLHSREHFCRHDMPCSSCVHCGSDILPKCL